MTTSNRFNLGALLLALIVAVPLGVLMVGCADDTGGVIGTCDSLPPTVTSTFPENRATDVSLNGNISATFSEEMERASIHSTSFTVQEGPLLVRDQPTRPKNTAAVVPGTIAYNGLTATFNPTSDLALNTVYTVTVTTGARDLSGNPLVNNYVWTFTTGALPDVTPPTVVSTVPEDSATSVSLNYSLTATFSEPMTPSTITAGKFSVRQGATVVTGTVFYHGVTATFNPTEPLLPSSRYTVTISTDVADLAGNQMAAAYTWSFTTGVGPDVTPPTVDFTTPPNHATDVSLNYSLTATFSEPMAPLTITTNNIKLRRGVTQVSGTVSYTGVTATFNPTSTMSPNTVYIVEVTSGVRDLAGNAMEGSYFWTFTTGTGPDITPPTVGSTVPTAGELNVSLNGNISATFSEVMSPLTITTASVMLHRGLTQIAGTVSYSGVTAVFNPTANLTPSTLYTVRITNRVRDLAGNAMVADYVWNFTTGVAPDVTPPTVNSTIPANNAVNVGLGGNFTATFSEPMAPLSISNTTVTLYNGNTRIAGNVTYNGVTMSFNPTNNLAANTLYTATITRDVRDLAGNRMVLDYVWTFTTGDAPDITPPTVNSTVPVNRAVDVGLGGNVSATFSEAMDPATITTATIRLNQGLTQIAGTVTMNGVTAIFNPAVDFQPSTVYTATITTGVRDLAGNRMTNSYTWTFTSGVASDQVLPTVSSTNPANRAVGVAISGNYTVTFSEAMDPATITTGTIRLHQGITQIQGVVTYNGVTATFNPSLTLLANTVYTATVTSDVRDMAGNRMANNYVWTFTTGAVPDNTPPNVSSTIPANRAVDVAIDGNYSVTFSEAMTPETITTGTITLHQGNNRIQGVVTYVGLTATFNPSNALAANTLYTATVTNDVEDLSGNTMVDDYVWTFTTGAAPDNVRPTVSATIPDDGAIGVALGGNYTVTFSEAMAPATISAATITLHQGNNQIQGAVSYVGVTATFNPNNNLAANTVYTATVTNDVEDLAGNAMAQNYVWTFTTGAAPDNVRPTVTATVPAAGAVGVALGGNYTVTFSEAMTAATITPGTVTLHQGNNQIQGAVSYVGVTATFNPNNNLAANTVYTATVTNGVTDLAGNAMAQNYVWTFTTGAAPDNVRPTVTATVPVDDATGIALNANYTVTFSEAMAPASITTATVTLFQGNDQIQGAVSYAGVVATFNPTNNLEQSTVYTATVTNAVRDLAGNAMEVNYVWTFTTLDATPPTVVSTVPVADSRGIALNSNITANFSEAMTQASINDQTMTLSIGGNPVAGAVSYAGVVATFNPTNNLSSNAVYTATITVGVRDLAGNAMAENFSWNFTTIDASPPTVVSTVPVANAVGIALNSNITANFSEAMAPATITAQTMTLTAGGNPVAGAVSYAGVVATFNPANDLVGGTVYTATITVGVRDLAGNAMAQNFVWTFTTLDASPPTVVSTVPVANAVNVAANSNVTATFSEAMAPATINAQTMTLTTGGNPVAGAVSYAGVVATFNPTNDLVSGAIYTATITVGVRDLAGNAMAQNFVWTFTTLDATPPTVVSTVPVANAIGVAVNTNVIATFSEAMAPATITAQTMTLTTGGNPVAGAVSYAGVAATFNPTNDLAGGTVYTATITSGVRDLAGNAMAQDFVWIFTTLDATPPTVISTVPDSGATGVGVNSNITAKFSERMDQETILANGTMILEDVNGNAVQGQVSYADSVATFNPADQLEMEVMYTATITVAAEDLAGNGLEEDYVWTFTTGQAGLNLGRAARFAILAHETVTNGGHSVITGDIGLSPGERAAVTGFPPGELVEGYAIYAAQDAEVVAGMEDLLTAYNDAAGRAVNRIGLGGGQNLAGETLAPGLYHSETSLAINGGDLTLDAQGNADAVWIFQMGSTLTLPDDGSGVILTNGAQSKNVFWQCGSSATIGTDAVFVGNVIVSVSISMGTRASLDGRILALNGSVTLLENAITVPAE